MDDEQKDGLAELRQVYELYTSLIALKEKNNGTPKGRMWAIAVTDCEKLVAWISYTKAS